MTSNTSDHSRDLDEERELTSIAARLLGMVPPRTPGTFPATGRCGWCSTSLTDHALEQARGQYDPQPEVDREQTEPTELTELTELTQEKDPAVWVLHVLGEHLRDLLAPSGARVKFNAAGGATVEVFDAYVEDVALVRDTLGVHMLGVLDLPTTGGCAVIFGGDPYARQVSLVWYTWPRFLRLADQLASAFWSVGHPQQPGESGAEGVGESS
jgi:hypothetical protein